MKATFKLKLPGHYEYYKFTQGVEYTLLHDGYEYYTTTDDNGLTVHFRNGLQYFFANFKDE